MAKKSVAKNYMYNLVYQVLIVILPIITAPYLSRVLGATKIGIYTYTYNIVSYFMLFGSLGVALYGKREIAYVQDDKKKRTQLFWEILVVKFITVTIATAIYVLVFIVLGKEYNIFYTILLFELLSTAVDITWFFQGLEDFKKTVTRNVIVRLVAVTCIFVFVKKPEDILKYTLIYSLGNFLGNLSLWVYVPKFIKGEKVSSLDLKRHIVPLLVLFLPQITDKIYNMMDTTMLGTMIKDKSEVGYYEQAQKIIRILNTVVASLGIVMVPRMSNLFVSGGKDAVQDVLKKSFRYVFFISIPIVFGLLVVVDDFIPIFYGPSYERTILIIKMLSLVIFLMGIENVIGSQYLIPTKQQKKYTISVLVGLITNIILNYFLIKNFLALGAAIATVLSQVIVDAIQLASVKNEMSLKEMFKPVIKYLIFGLVMYLICIGVKYLSHRFIILSKEIYTDIATVVLQIIIGAISYILLLIGTKDELVTPVINKVLNKINKKVKEGE